MKQKLFGNDLRETKPQRTGYREKEFRRGWQEGSKQTGEDYSHETLENLTWRNLGYRLGRLFGKTSPELIGIMYDWCVRQQQSTK